MARVLGRQVDEIRTLPCGLTINASRGECCARNCPDPRIRATDTRRPWNAIERCWRKWKAQGLHI